MLRDDVPALRNTRYFNTGGTGPCSRRVSDAWIELERYIQSVGPDAPPARERVAAVEARVRRELAQTLGVDVEELAMTRNIAEGIDTVAWGHEWQAGDEVLLTDQEHPTGQMPWLNLAERRGITIHRVALTSDVDQLLGRVAAAITPRTRLVAFSHVTCEDGLRLPAREIVELAHAHGVPVLFDGAQAVGQFPIDLHEIGCDYYATTGLKWVCAGRGVGGFYVRRDRIPDLKVSWSGAYAPASFDMATGAFRFHDDARRFEFGGRNWQMYASYAEALAQLRELGVAGIEATVRTHAEKLKRRLAAIDGCEVLTPLEPERATGIVTFQLANHAGSDLVSLLWGRHRIICRAAFGGRAVRLSVAFFTSGEEVALAADAVAELARELARSSLDS